MADQCHDQLCKSNNTVESVWRIETISSEDMNRTRSTKLLGNQATNLVRPPFSSPTFDQDTQSFESSTVKTRLVVDWTTAFLFSIESEQTIGYGTRAITTKCPEGTLILQIQSLVGMILDAFMLGLTFAKLSQPRDRVKTVMFSDYAVIAPRDGKLCLMFRVGDIRKSQIVDASIRMQLFRKWKTKEEKHFPFYQEDLKVCYDWRNPDNDFRNQIFLLLPMVIIHVIDENSPLYNMTPVQLRESECEVVVVMDGIVEHTGLNTQPKTSYTSDEILWGYDFQDVIDRNCLQNGKYYVDFSKFNDISRIMLPSCSPKEFYEMVH